jgi:hypothetical protein
MAVSRGAEDQSGTFYRRTVGRLSRYDLLLAVIPLVFALALVASVVTPVSREAALAGGAVLSSLCFLDAVYINPPVDSPPGR